MAQTKKVTAKPVQAQTAPQQESDKQAAKFAAPFVKTQTREEAKRVYDALIAGFKKAYEDRLAGFKKPATAAPKAKPAASKEATPAPETAPAKPAEEAVKPIKEGDKKAIKKLHLEFHDYSEKSFVIVGDTKPIKAIMEKYKGRFNRYLSVGAGWVFAKRYEAEVRAALAI